MLKKLFFFCAFFCFLLLFSSICSAISVSARHAVLIEAQSGDIVYSKDADTRAPMASTTKIMTALVAIENANLDKQIKISKDAVGIEGSSVYLKENEIFSLEDLLYALLLESANDAATAIAIEIGGSVEGFASMMNEKANSLGLKNTHFTNPHGLDDAEHYTTASDLARLAVYAMNNPKFYEIASSKKRVVYNGDDEVRVFVNHNKLLRNYDGAVGVKTGFTKKSGRCLVSCAERDGVRLVAVTLNAPNDWNDHSCMLDFGFEQYENIHLAENGDYVLSLSCVNGQRKNVLCTNFSSLDITLKRGEYKNLTAKFESERFLFAPVRQGDRVGRIVYYLNGSEVASVNLYALEAVKPIKYKKSIFERIFG